MTADKTHDLLLCNRISTVLPSVNNPGIAPYNGSILKFDSDVRKTYRIRKNVQARFLDGLIPTDSYPGFIDGYSVRYSITSMKFNGQELMTTPANLTYSYSDIIWSAFPFYTLGNEFGYTDNVANAIAVATSPTDAGKGTSNFYLFVESVMNLFDIPVKISRCPATWWDSAEYVRLKNIIIEKYYDDNFEFTFVETTIDNSNSNETSNTKRYIFNGEIVAYELNGSIAVTDLPQFSDSFSFFSYDFAYRTLTEVDSCAFFEPFNTSLSSQGCSDLKITADCGKITFSDTSNYGTNGMPGHDPELFNTRVITITKPDGAKYIYATSNIEPRNETIQPYLNSPNTFQYNINSNDVDGIYSVQLCSYPDWVTGVVYDVFLQPIVWRDGKLYKAIATNASADPSLPENAIYWTEYDCTDNCDDTRYCVTERIVVLCISLLKCYKKLVADAFCSIKLSPCKDMCSNKAFQNAMKFRVTLDALEFSVCAKDWNSAQSQIDILNSLCCCS